MPKKKRHETPAEQSARFKAEAKKLIAAGKLNPTDAEAAVDRFARASRTTKRQESTASCDSD